MNCFYQDFDHKFVFFSETPDFPESGKKILVGLGKKPRAKFRTLEEIEAQERGDGAREGARKRAEDTRKKAAEEVAGLAAENQRHRLQRLFSKAYESTRNHLKDAAEKARSGELDLMASVKSYAKIRNLVSPFVKELEKYMSDPDRGNDILLVRSDGVEVSGSYFLQGGRYKFNVAGIARVFGLSDDFDILAANMHRKSEKFFTDSLEDLKLLQTVSMPELRKDILDEKDIATSAGLLKTYAKQIRGYSQTAKQLRDIFGASSPLGMRCKEVIAKTDELDGRGGVVSELTDLIKDKIGIGVEVVENSANKLLKDTLKKAGGKSDEVAKE